MANLSAEKPNFEYGEGSSSNTSSSFVLKNDSTTTSIHITEIFSHNTTFDKKLIGDSTFIKTSQTDSYLSEDKNSTETTTSISVQIRDEQISTKLSSTHILKTDPIITTKEAFTTSSTYITEKKLSTKLIETTDVLKSSQVSKVSSVPTSTKDISTVESTFSDNSKTEIQTKSTIANTLSRISTSSVKPINEKKKLFTEQKLKTTLKWNISTLETTNLKKNIKNRKLISESSSTTMLATKQFIPPIYNDPSKEISSSINTTSVFQNASFGATTLVLVVILPFLTLFIIAIVIVLKKKFKKKTSRRKRNKREDNEMDTKDSNQRQPLTNINVDSQI